MKPELILQSDVLDIIFEGRNKEYGAYALRKGYDGTMLKAMYAILGIVLALFVMNYWKNNSPDNLNDNSLFFDKDSVVLTIVDLEPPKPIEELPLAPQPERTPVATTDYQTPIIVDDNLVEEVQPEMSELETREISDQTIEGPLSTSTVQSQPNAPVGNETVQAAPEPPVEEPEILHIAQIQPEFPGGETALRRFLSKNLRVPEDKIDPGTRITVKARFVVDKEGKITGVEVLQSGGIDCDKEVMRVLNKMPKWKPGIQNGRNVAVYFHIPIIFQVDDE